MGTDAATRLMACAAGGDSRLAARLSDSDAVVLILDGSGERILYASTAATALRQAVADAGGRVRSAPGIGAQIARARPRIGAPLLLRLHVDPRRIAPPALVTVLRTAGNAGSEALILVAAAAALPRLRTRPLTRPDVAALSDEPAGTPAEAPNPPRSAPDRSEDPSAAYRRFTWRSEADDTLSDLSRWPGDPVRERMLGRSWRTLSASGTLRDADGLLAALAQGRTFRAIPVTLVAADGTLFELDLSGSPIDRSGRGFRGFGQVRSIAKPDAIPKPEASPPVAEPEAPQRAATDETVAVTDRPRAASPAPAFAGELPAEDAESAPSDPSLSSNEHAAFREIARALGARFAGDEVQAVPLERGLPCAVMPFPATASRAAASPDAAMVATLERLPAGVLVYRDNAVLFANRRLLDLTGYADAATLDAAGGIGRLFGGLLPHVRAPSDTPLVLTARDGGRLGVLIEHSALDWAGQAAELLLARDAEPSEASRASAADALAQDFVGRRGADALAVLETLEDGIATLDGQGRILALNRSAAMAFGLDPREVVGASFLGLFAPENAVDLLARLHAEPGSEVADAAAVSARATSAGLRVKVLPMHAPNTLPDHLPMSESGQGRLCAVISPAAEQGWRDAAPSDAQRQAEAENRQKSEFLAGVSQEIRTPIHGILGAAELILSEPHGPLGSEHYRKSLQDIHASGTHLLDVVDGLLDLARIEAGRLDLNVTPIPLNEVVARCVALLQPQASRERIVLRTSFSADLEVLMADERSVRHAALNVIANAIAFTAAGGQVIVSTTMADRGEIALRVRDTGIGMTADEVEVALHPFRQLGQPVHRDGARRGTGLGLPLTKALVEANHGRLRIDSRKDEGTLVEMLFPVNAATKRA